MKGKDIVGKTFPSNKYGEFVVIDYKDYDNVLIKFKNTGYETTIQAYHLKDGAVKDRSAPSVYGVGVVGDGICSFNNIKLKEYTLWRGLLGRCYGSTSKNHFSTYVDCTVSDNFKFYPYFKNWCNEQIGFSNKGWELDKDILVKGNKIYSEDTCCFVPKEINLLFCKADQIRSSKGLGVKSYNTSNRYRAYVTISGKVKHLGTFDTPEDAFYAYKVSKEAHIKDVANKWKDRIDPRVYEALMKYEVEIDD